MRLLFFARPFFVAFFFEKIDTNTCRFKNFWQSLQRHHTDDPPSSRKTILYILFPILSLFRFWYPCSSGKLSRALYRQGIRTENIDSSFAVYPVFIWLSFSSNTCPLALTPVRIEQLSNIFEDFSFKGYDQQPPGLSKPGFFLPPPDTRRTPAGP